MAVRDGLVRLALDTPAPAFVAAGRGSDLDVARLRVSGRVRLVRSPRHATVLVVTGHLPESFSEALRRTHDQLPSPRVTALLGEGTAASWIPDATRVGSVDEIAGLHRRLLEGGSGDGEWGPARNPVEWQGVGPYGTGGEGMMGGKPYGRPMAMTAVGRDGLALDRFSLPLGPFLAGLPAGLSLRVGLQGDVVEEISLERSGVMTERRHRREPLHAARTLLVAMAELLALAGLEALARRAAALAVAERPVPADIVTLRRRVNRPWSMRAATDGVGDLEVEGLPAGDVTARWRRWLDRSEAILRGSEDHLDSVADSILGRLADALVGMELGRALLTLASLRPELQEEPVATGADA